MNRREMIQAVGAGAAALAWAGKGMADDAPGDAPDSWKGIQSSQGTRASIRNLPTTIRPKVDPADILVPDGYELEALVVGLSFPTCVEFGDDRTLYIGEGAALGRPAPPSRRGS